MNQTAVQIAPGNEYVSPTFRGFARSFGEATAIEWGILHVVSQCLQYRSATLKDQSVTKQL